LLRLGGSARPRTTTPIPANQETNISQHGSHVDVIKRLKRAEGHLRSTISMIEGGRPGLDIAQQLQAIERAIINAKKLLIHDHIDHCLQHTIKDGQQSADETILQFKAITKYL